MTLMQIFLAIMGFILVALDLRNEYLKDKAQNNSGKTLSTGEKILLEKLGENYERNPYIRRRQYLMETTKAS